MIVWTECCSVDNLCVTDWKSQYWTHSQGHAHICTHIYKCWWSRGCLTTLWDSRKVNNVPFPSSSSSIPSFLPTWVLLSLSNRHPITTGCLSIIMNIQCPLFSICCMSCLILSSICIIRIFCLRKSRLAVWPESKDLHLHPFCASWLWQFLLQDAVDLTFTDAMLHKRWWQSSEELRSCRCCAMCLSVAWMQSAAAPPQRERPGSRLICRQAWWDNFHILLSRLWSALSPHQHGYACGLVPHHTIMTIPGYVFNVLSRLLLSDFAIGCQVCTVSPYRAIKTKFFHCRGNEWSGLTVDYIDNKVQTLYILCLAGHQLSSHDLSCIYSSLLFILAHILRHDEAHRSAFGFDFIRAERITSHHSLPLFWWLSLTSVIYNHAIAGPNHARPLSPSPTIVLPPLLQKRIENPFSLWLWVFDSLNLLRRNFNL